MITDETMRDNLTRHLSRLGKTTADLSAEIDSAFGSPLLSVAAGSILHGFGNITSDVDVHVVVDHPNVTDLPIPSMWPGAAVDVNYINATAIAEAATELVSADAAGPGTRAAWHDARRRLAQLSRLSLGLALDGTDEWRSWQTALRAPVVEAMIRWWRTEAARYRCAAEILRSNRPLLAAHRYCSAGLAALDVLATSAGETYFGPKWIGEKLTRLGNPELIESYRRLLDLPITETEAGDYLAETAHLLTTLATEAKLPLDPVLTLSPAGGLTHWSRHEGRALLHRWGLRGIEVDAEDAEACTTADWHWRGTCGQLSTGMRKLIDAELVWLTVEASE